MKMKQGIVLLALLSGYSFPGFSAEEGAGKIHFTGEIISPSCTISGTSGTESTVELGTFPTSLFTSTGVESTKTLFTIVLANCPLTTDGLPAVQLTFNGTTTLTGSTSLLDVSKITTTGSTAATGVGVAVSPKDADTTLLKFDGTEEQVYIELPTSTEDTIRASFNARYKSFSSTVTAGPADADLTVNILYR